MSIEIRISDRPVRFARATHTPGFREKRIIASTPWEFVSLWLRKQGLDTAEIYWNQSRNFFDAAKDLPTESAPLPLYYAFLNVTKALLEAKNVTYNPYHGVQGFDMRTPANGRIRLDNEGLKMKAGGVLPVNRRRNGDRDRHIKGYHLRGVVLWDVGGGRSPEPTSPRTTSSSGPVAAGAQLRFLNRQLSLPVSTMSQ